MRPSPNSELGGGGEASVHLYKFASIDEGRGKYIRRKRVSFPRSFALSLARSLQAKAVLSVISRFRSSPQRADNRAAHRLAWKRWGDLEAMKSRPIFGK